MKSKDIVKVVNELLNILNEKTFTEHSEKNSGKRDYSQFKYQFLKKNFDGKILLLKEGIKENLKNSKEINQKIDAYLKEKKYSELKSFLKTIENKVNAFEELDSDEENTQKKTTSLTQAFRLPKKIPDAIKDEMLADIEEMKKCFENECYRSCMIICGRLLETALHRKYFEVTNNDILETNPGIGLGTLIAKLHEKNVEFEPGLKEQIHLINQVRIYSVHKKSKVFIPSKEKTQAVMFFTLDVLNKIFS